MASHRPARPRSRPRRSRALAATALLLTTLGPAVALADARTEARRHFRRGMELVVERRIDEGVAELEEAYNILPHPNVLYNIGRAYAEVGRYEESREYFDRYLESDPPDREEVRAIVAAIESRIATRAEEAQASAETTEGTTEASTGSTDAAAPVSASAEQLATLDGAIEQVSLLCRAAGSGPLCEREQRLRALRETLTAAPTAAAGTSDTTTTDANAQAGDATTPADDGAALAVATSRGDAAYVESVDAAARQRSSSLDAPASTTVITRQDIRMSGVTQIGELLRRAAGVTVMTPTPSASNVSIRGFNRLLAPRVLMLVNGRTTYFDPLGTPFWDSQDVQVEDIERIEVIRGPASVLYGANGMAGIVNIVTRTPGEGGTEVSGSVGNARQARGHLSTSGRVGDLSYRLSGGYQQYDRYTVLTNPERVDYLSQAQDPERALQASALTADLRYRATDDITLSLDAGVNYASAFNFYAVGAFLDFYAHGPTSHFTLTAQAPYGRARVFYNRTNFDIDVTDGAIDGGYFRNNTFDVEVELTKQFHLLVDHDLHLGVNYRLKNVDWSFFTNIETEHHQAVFFEDTMRVNDKLRIVAAVRMDHHPLLPDLMFSPRGAVIVRPTEGQAIRATAGTAFRTPSMQDTYVDFLLDSPVTAVDVYALGSEVARRRFPQSRDALEPETIVSAELGYLNQESDFFSLDVAGYYNRVDGLISFRDGTNRLRLVDYATPGMSSLPGSQDRGSLLAGFDPGRSAFVVGDISLVNEPAVYHQAGGEVSVRTYPVDGLDVYANYAFNYTWTVGGPRDGQVDRRHPQHMVNAGVQYRAPFGLDLSADVHYSGSQVWPELETTLSGIGRVQLPNPDYYLLNARVAYRMLDDRLEFAVAGTNITGNRTAQHPSGQAVATRVLGTVTARF